MGSLVGRRLRAVLAAALVFGSLGGAVLVSQTTAGATAPTVKLYVSASGSATTGCTSGNPCHTIQEGVTAAETHTTDAVTVTVAAGTYTGGITIAASKLASLTIKGAGASSTKVTGHGEMRDFSATSGAVTISQLSIDDGSPSESTAHSTLGGGIYSSGTSLTLTTDILAGDHAKDGGGFYISRTTATISTAHTTVSDDTATTDGGGGFADGTATLLADPDNTYSTDHAKEGGGFYNTSDNVGFTNDTLSSDTATYGGAVYNTGTGAATLTDDTLSGDTATTGGGIYNAATATATASILDGSSCFTTEGAKLSGTYDVWTTTTGCRSFFTGVTTTKTAIDLTTTLKPNTSAGPETLALLPGSPAIDEVPKTACTVTTDERGEPRPGDPSQTLCDAGAYELQIARKLAFIVEPVTVEKTGTMQTATGTPLHVEVAIETSAGTRVHVSGVAVILTLVTPPLATLPTPAPTPRAKFEVTHVAHTSLTATTNATGLATFPAFGLTATGNNYKLLADTRVASTPFNSYETVVACLTGKPCTATATNTTTGTTASITAPAGKKTYFTVNFHTTKYPLYGCTKVGTETVVNWTGARTVTLTYTETHVYKTAKNPFRFFTFCYGSSQPFLTGNLRQSKYDPTNKEYEGTLPLCIVSLIVNHGEGPCIILEVKSGTSQIYYVESGPGDVPKGGGSG